MTKQKPDWLKLKLEEVEKIIINLAKKEVTSEKIGLILRDSYGIPTLKAYNTTISKILEKNNIKIDSELQNLGKKAEKLKTHFKIHKHDQTAKRALTITEAKIRGKKNYNKKRGKNAKED